MGWTRASGPKTQGADLEDEPEDHAARPRSQDWLAGQAEDEPDIKARPLILLAPKRWHTEAVAVQKLAASPSRIAFSISRLPVPQASIHELGGQEPAGADSAVRARAIAAHGSR